MTLYTYLSSYNNRGIPTRVNLDSDNQNIMNNATSSLVTESLAFLPGGQTIVDVHPDWMRNSDISTVDDCEITLTFLDEGAGYKNGLSYFVYDKANPPSRCVDIDEVFIVFPNCSKVFSGGSMVSGYTMQLAYNVTSHTITNGRRFASGFDYIFPAGKGIGFIIHANKWTGDGSSGAYLRTGTGMFTSNPVLNPEPLESLRHHAVNYKSVVDPTKIVYGFEDIRRTKGNCDHDFNDLTFFITPSPLTAIDTTYNSTTSQVFQGVFLCEDLLNKPTADLDYNDLGGTYKVTETISSDKITSILFELNVACRGASLNHNFGVIVPNIKNMQDVHIYKEHYRSAENTEFSEITSDIIGQGTDKIPIIIDTKEFLPNGSIWATNTIKDTAIQTPSLVKLRIDFGGDGVERSELNGMYFPYNFYLDVFRGDKPMWSLFSDQDYSDVSEEYTNMGINTLKKILILENITSFRFPFEKQPFGRVYHKYKSFLCNNPYYRNWYKTDFVKTGLLYPDIEDLSYVHTWNPLLLA